MLPLRRFVLSVAATTAVALIPSAPASAATCDQYDNGGSTAQVCGNDGGWWRNMSAGGTLASFTVTGLAQMRDANIDWGDGSPIESAQASCQMNCTGSFSRSHTYASEGTFTITINAFGLYDPDGASQTISMTATATATVTNHAPEADDQSLAVQIATKSSITLTGTEPDGDPLTFTVVTQPRQGKLGGKAPDLTYTPRAKYTGPDSFTFRVSDGRLTDTGTVSLNVVNNVPVQIMGASVCQKTGPFLTVTSGGYPWLDPDGPLTPPQFQILVPPLYGTVSGTGDQWTYTPTVDADDDQWTWRAYDGFFYTTSDTIDLHVQSPTNGPCVVFRRRFHG